MADVSKRAVNHRLLARAESAEEGGHENPGYLHHMQILLITKQYRKFYEHLRGKEIPEYVRKEFSRYKLIHVLQTMPAGKRKYILLHKRAYDMYKELKQIPRWERTSDQGKNIISLRRLMDNLKSKINN